MTTRRADEARLRPAGPELERANASSATTRNAAP